MFDTPPEVWEWVFDVNVRGVVHGALVFGPVLVEQGAGHVVCTASIAGVTDTPTLPPYGVSKHAVVGLAAAMRGELAGSRRRRLGAVSGPDQHPHLRERTQPARGHGRSVGRQPDVEGVPRDDRRRRATRAGRRRRVPGGARQPVLRVPDRDLDALVEARIADIRQGFEWRTTLPDLTILTSISRLTYVCDGQLRDVRRGGPYPGSDDHRRRRPPGSICANNDASATRARSSRRRCRCSPHAATRPSPSRTSRARPASPSARSSATSPARTTCSSRRPVVGST